MAIFVYCSPEVQIHVCLSAFFRGQLYLLQVHSSAAWWSWIQRQYLLAELPSVHGHLQLEWSYVLHEAWDVCCLPHHPQDSLFGFTRMRPIPITWQLHLWVSVHEAALWASPSHAWVVYLITQHVSSKTYLLDIYLGYSQRDINDVNSTTDTCLSWHNLSNSLLSLHYRKFSVLHCDMLIFLCAYEISQVHALIIHILLFQLWSSHDVWRRKWNENYTLLCNRKCSFRDRQWVCVQRQTGLHQELSVIRQQQSDAAFCDAVHSVWWAHCVRLGRASATSLFLTLLFCVSFMLISAHTSD